MLSTKNEFYQGADPRRDSGTEGSTPQIEKQPRLYMTKALRELLFRAPVALSVVSNGYHFADGALNVKLSHVSLDMSY